MPANPTLTRGTAAVFDLTFDASALGKSDPGLPAKSDSIGLETRGFDSALAPAYDGLRE